jgi:hypothetical protein
MRASDVCVRVRVCVCARACVSGSASVSLPRGLGRAAILDTSSLRATLWPVNFPVDSSPSISKFSTCILQTSALREWTGRPRKSTHRHMPCRNSCSARPHLFRELGCLTCSTVPLVVRAGSGRLLVRDGATRQQREQPRAAPSGSHGDAKGSRGRSPLRTCAARLPGIPWIPVGRTCFGNWREGHRARAKLMPRTTRSASTPAPPPHTRAHTPDPQTHAHARTRARTRMQTRSRLRDMLAQAPQQTRAQTRRRCRSN